MRATIDCRRTGYLDPIPVDWLRDLHGHYHPTFANDRDIDDGLRWATERLYANTGLLDRRDLSDGQHAYDPYDYLVDHVSGTNEPSRGDAAAATPPTTSASYSTSAATWTPPKPRLHVPDSAVWSRLNKLLTNRIAERVERSMEVSRRSEGRPSREARALLTAASELAGRPDTSAPLFLEHILSSQQRTSRFRKPTGGWRYIWRVHGARVRCVDCTVRPRQ